MCEESVKKVRVFGLGYVRVDVWEKFIGVCEWCDGCERILIFFKGVKCYFTDLPLFIKKINNKMSCFCLKWTTFTYFVDLKIINIKKYTLNVNMYNIKIIIRKKICIQQIK